MQTPGIHNSLSILLLCVLSATAPCQQPATTTAPPSDTSPTWTDAQYMEKVGKQDDVDVAVEKGLKLLATRQDLTYGKFLGKLPNAYTGLACLALMAHGHFPGRSEYGASLKKGIAFLAKEAIAKQGYLGGDGGRMYGHGICTLALTEAYGMMDRDTDNREIRKALELAIRLILKSQIKSDTPHRGGWRYEPTSQDADLSVAVWQILALRGAQNCRLDVPESAIRDALDYVRRCYSAPARGFCYQAGQNAASPAMRVAGVVCMLALGADETDEDKRKIADSASVLQQDILPQSKHFFYTAYYWMTAANMLETPETAAVLAKAEQFIAKLQTDNGSFQNYKDFDGDVYSTAFALICLSVRQQYLPIYQE